MKTIILFAFILSASAQNTTVPIGNLTVPNEAAAAYESWRIVQIVPITPVSLTAGINASVTTFGLTGDLSQLTAGDQFSVDSEVFTVVSKAGQNITVSARALYAIGGISISTPAIHSSGASLSHLRWPSAVAGFKELLRNSVQQALQSYCPTHPATCPTLATQYTALDTANAAIAAIMAQVVQ